MQSDSVGFPGAAGVGVTRVRRFGVEGRCFKNRVHKIVNSIVSPLKNHEASRFLKLKEVFMPEAYRGNRTGAMGSNPTVRSVLNGANTRNRW